MGSKSIPELSVDTSLLADRIRKLQPNEVITWEQLSAVISRDVRTEAHANLSSARKIVQRDDAIVTAAVKKVGIKRLDDDGIVGTSDGTMATIHRAAARGIKRIACIADVEKLSNESKVKLNASRAGLGALHEITKRKSIERIEKAVVKSQAVLPLADTMRLFANGKE